MFVGHEMSRVELLPQVRSFVARVGGSFVDGKFGLASGAVRQLFDPSTAEPIANLHDCGPQETDRAVRSAHAAFEDGRWSGLRPADRERVLLKFADLVEANAEELAQLESWNQGKSINIARAVDVGASVEFMRYYAGLATKITGQTFDVSIAMPPGTKYTAYTRREPIGVVAGVTPWNFPMMIGLWKIMPALAAGCSIVLKPSELTPLTTFRLAELAMEAGVPAGVFNVVHGDGATVGAVLVAHPLVRKISFTGSTVAGKAIARIAAEQVKRVTLELGGKNPAIVLADADLSKAVPGLLMAGLLNGGQVCAAVSRIYVERPLYDGLVGAISDAFAAMAIGPGLDPDAQVNPMVSSAHQAKVLGHINAARANGLTLSEGRAVPETGFYVSPTLITGADAESPIQREEVFGPVMSVTPVENLGEALRLANDTAYGLAASLWTESLTQTMRAVPQIQAGTVWVNSHVPLDPSMPFGGYKESGYGRDFGVGSLEAYTEVKSICIAH